MALCSLRRCCLTLAGLFLAAGCSGSDDGDLPPRAAVSGIVTHNGQPVEGATVLFFPQGEHNHVATGLSNASGKYALQTFGTNDGAVPAKFAVTVRKTELIYTGAAPVPGAADDAEVPPSVEKHMLPEKYGDASTSGLEATVAAGQENVFNFELEGAVTGAEVKNLGAP